jgi:MFS family permease
LLVQKNKKPFYGWAIVASGALGNALQGGFIIWSMGMFTSSLEDLFGETRARVTLIETCISVSVNLMFPLVGLWVDKRSARHLVAFGAVSMGAGLCVAAVAGQLLHVWIAFATLIPLGILALGMLPSSALISRWFRKSRGLGLGISVAGSSIGGFLAPPLVAYLLMAHGWRTALLTIGIGIICLAPLFYWIVANHPEDKGCKRLEPGEDELEPNEPAEGELWSVKEVLLSPATYQQAIVSGCLIGITLAMLANLSLHAKDLGLSDPQIGILYSVAAMCSFGSKIMFGIIIDRFGVKWAGFMAISVMATSMLLFLLAGDFKTLLVAVFVLGLGIGGATPVWMSLIATGFGARSFGRALGLQNPMHIPITAPIAPIAGHISDVTGSYQLVFAGFLGLTLLAAIALQQLKLPVRRHQT